MKSYYGLVLASLASVAHAYAPIVKQQAFTTPTTTTSSRKKSFDVGNAAMASLTALTIASNVFLAPVAQAMPDYQPFTSSSVVLSEKVVREGVYGEYEVDVTPQAVDDARSTFKEAKETKSKKGKYTALIAILVVGSFIIPMAQYFWYVKDDDSSDRFFEAQNIPDPEPEPKKKGWFGK
mmetsp:Transcript_294/g.400  ORF Transcript_294/g.400 Transcript_294/m.400 type:complete len:179 (-) Transcript_294:277-813(-)|eukprot:CAMPEP_0172490098 /NCGR_PEP_ID=MMETSP1066-20121228/20447_1 /TAXON_ID=671091 /ORGANISM="Coscinodiscus wailesii, Strain CCMP2513" /LENGTH=178 /DNA_ID=CAMNT_0013258403 /DNA_START=241 /DNA_END=777 /DNA_ORIENTATION=+